MLGHADEFKITVAYILIEEIEAGIDHVPSGIEAAVSVAGFFHFLAGDRYEVVIRRGSVDSHCLFLAFSCCLCFSQPCDCIILKLMSE